MYSWIQLRHSRGPEVHHCICVNCNWTFTKIQHFVIKGQCDIKQPFWPPIKLKILKAFKERQNRLFYEWDIVHPVWMFHIICLWLFTVNSIKSDTISHIYSNLIIIYILYFVVFLFLFQETLQSAGFYQSKKHDINWRGAAEVDIMFLLLTKPYINWNRNSIINEIICV